MKKDIDENYQQKLTDAVELLYSLVPPLASTAFMMMICTDRKMRAVEELDGIDISWNLLDSSEDERVKRLCYVWKRISAIHNQLSNLNNLEIEEVEDNHNETGDMEDYQRDWLKSRGLLPEPPSQEQQDLPAGQQNEVGYRVPFYNYSSLSPKRRYKKLSRQMSNLFVDYRNMLDMLIFDISGEYYRELLDDDDVNVRLLSRFCCLLSDTGSVFFEGKDLWNREG